MDSMKEIWADIRGSLDRRRFFGSFRDRWVWLAFLIGGIGLLFPAGGIPPLWRLAFAAVTEELAYRALLQRQLEQCVPGKWGLFTGGMLMTSALFALSHLPTHTPLMAALTFSLRLPSVRSGRATVPSGSAPPSISGIISFCFYRLCHRMWLLFFNIVKIHFFSIVPLKDSITEKRYWSFLWNFKGCVMENG